MLRVPVQPEVGELLPETVILKYVQHASHLAENEHPGPLLFEPGEELVQDTHLAAVDNQVGVGREGRTCAGSCTHRGRVLRPQQLAG